MTEQGIDNGNIYVFCDAVDHGNQGCVRGAGHDGPHAFCLPPYPQQPIILRAAARLIPEVRAPQDWQPISTAPTGTTGRDSEEFLVWDDEDACCYVVRNSRLGCVLSNGAIADATYWMPLPHKPITAAGSDHLKGAE